MHPNASNTAMQACFGSVSYAHMKQRNINYGDLHGLWRGKFSFSFYQCRDCPHKIQNMTRDSISQLVKLLLYSFKIMILGVDLQPMSNRQNIHLHFYRSI